MGYTPEQEKCILCLTGPVDVSAGAGSGKTFTLTQRIAHALARPESGVDDIDQVLAITFTKKAAAELKGRVRSTLRAQGMFDQARKVDGAWISTIHGMCARLLRASALEIGLDPGFSVLENASDVLDQALDEVLEENGQSSSDAYGALFTAYDAVPKGPSGESVMVLLRRLLNEVHALRYGFDDLWPLVSPDDPSGLARALMANYEEAQELMQQVKESATQAKNVLACEEALVALNALLMSEDALTGQALRQTLDSCKRLNGGCGTKEQKTRIKELQASYDELVIRTLLCENKQVFEQLLALGRKVEERFVAKKRALSVLDQGDLICEALRALEHPLVAYRYENKFHLVMVDEFQDTDALQLAIVKKLAGEGQRYLCTVGDAQQSIYRFRGADVALYRAYQRDMFDQAVVDTGGKPRSLRLTRNFRSHGDILAFVKKVCAQTTVFGSDFLDLQAVYDGAAYRAHHPRIFIDITALPVEKDGSDLVKSDLLAAQAQRIVEYFDQMCRAGHDLSQMVLLLGVTTHADLYAQALRQAGFDCVISGGSLFAQSDEAQHMVHLARALVNFQDTEALANVLIGPLFQLSAQEMCALATTFDEALQQAVKGNLSQGLAACAAQLFGEDRETFTVQKPALAHAVSLLYGARRALRWQPLSRVLLRLLGESGCFSRLERQGAQGSARIANYMKALRLMEATEAQGGCGPAYVALQYRLAIEEGLKEAPGALNIRDQQAIRIMTIHASKGLEFPIVALADFVKEPRTSNLLLARFAGQTYGALFPKREKIGMKFYGKTELLELVSEEEEPSAEALQGPDSLKAQALLQRCALKDEACEGQRLFYVGATRAKEALGVFMGIQQNKDATKTYPGVYGDIVRGLFTNGEVPVGDSWADYGGSQAARVRFQWCEKADEAEGASQQEFAEDQAKPSLQEEASGSAAAPLREVFPISPPAQLDARMWLASQEGIFSYSSLEGSSVAGEELVGFCVDGDKEDASPADTGSRRAVLDADKATDFGLALHRLCQLSCAVSAQKALDQLASCAASYGVKDLERLRHALTRWLESAAYQRALRAVSCLPEHPFTLLFEPTQEVFEGCIDLLCVERDEEGCRKAFVVDYKTGGMPFETQEDLRRKHGLQAFCYAYALLKEGFDLIDMEFVRVEQDDPAGEDTLQKLGFRFDAGSLSQIETALSARRALCS